MNTVAQVAQAKTAELIAFYNKHNVEKPVKKFTNRETAEKRVIDLIDRLAEEAALAAPVQEVIELPPVVEETPKVEPAKEEKKEFTLGAAHKRVLRNIATSEYTQVNGAEPANLDDVGSVWANVVLETAADKRAYNALVENGYVGHDGEVGANLAICLTHEGFKAYKATATEELPEVKAPKSNAAGVAASWADPKVVEARLKRDGVSVTDHQTGKTADYRSVRKAFEELGLPDVKHIRFRMKLKASREEIFEFEGKKYTFKI